MFLANYSDGLTDLDLNHMIDEFRAGGKVAAFMAAPPSQSFHLVDVDDGGTSQGSAPSASANLLINAGFFALRQEVFDYIRPGEELVLAPFTRLIEKGQAPRLPVQPVLVHGHLQGAAAADRPVQLRPRALGGLEVRGHGRGASMMLPVAPRSSGGLELLCLGAHSDDLEIGCRGTMLRLLREWPVERITWVVLSGNDARASEARRSARRVLGRRPGCRMVQAEFRDGFFPHDPVPLKEYFETLKREVRPDVILTHHLEDRHQDHRFVAELTFNTFRDHLVLEYEIPKTDGDIGNPNFYVPLPATLVDRKVRMLTECFGSQRDKRWFSEELFRGVMRLRGMEAGSPSGYAEAFYGRKLVL